MTRVSRRPAKEPVIATHERQPTEPFAGPGDPTDRSEPTRRGGPGGPNGPSGLPGLTEAEATRRRAAGDGNEMPTSTGRTYRQIVRDNVFNFINNILFVLAAVLIAFRHYLDALLSVGVVVANTVISLYQEMRAKRTLDRIAILTRPHAVVVRDGVEREVDPAELVVGDIIRAQSGDQIVVDGHVVGPGYLEIDESLLTGESDLVVKRSGDAVLSGSFCVAGSGYYEAETVGADSFANRVTATAQAHRRFLTPLQHQANVLVWILLVIALAFVALVVAQHFTQHLPWVETVQATTVIVGLVPNSLILAIVLAYALGAVRMAGKGALIQEANAVESLSNVDVLCTDKTGTLTTNAIRLHDIEPLEAARDELERLLSAYAASTGVPNRTIEALAEALPGRALAITDEAAFSSSRKWSGLTFAADALPWATLVLGAPEVIAPRLQAGAALGERQAEWSAAGLRVLLVAGARTATRFAPPGESGPGDPGAGSAGVAGVASAATAAQAADSAAGAARAGRPPVLPGGLVPLGLVSLADELRPKVAETLAEFAAAGIEVKVISGDDPRTVSALATQAGLGGELTAYSGAELAAFDEREFAAAAANGAVFGRVSPQQKEALARALHQRGRYVAMVGDGVNDVIALKRADLGIAMESGSPAARGVADLVLMSDSFGVLPAAFREGQRIRNGMQDILNIFAVRIFSRALVIPFVALIGGFAFSPRQSALLSYLTATVPTIGLIVWAQSGQTIKGRIYRPLARFAVPATILLAAFELAVYTLYFKTGEHSYLLAHHGATTAQAVQAALPKAQTVTTALAVLCGILLLPFTVPPSMRWVGGARLRGDRRPTIMAAVLFVAYLIIVSSAGGRHLFAMQPIGVLQQILLIVIAVSWGFTVRAVWHWRVLDRLFGPPEGRPLPQRPAGRGRGR
jgi:cation-transporting ATPase E